MSDDTASPAPEVRSERIEAGDGAGAVVLLTVSDPKRRNAMTAALAEQLVAAVTAAQDDAGVHALVVTGGDDPVPAFCAGGDLDELAAAGEGGPEDLRRIYAGFLALAECPLPTFAAVDGPAVGAGLNLALAADVRLAGETARFEPGFLRLGVHPGGGMTWMAHRIVGPQATVAMLLGGEGLDAERAAAVGMVLRVVPGSEPVEGRSPVVAEALRMARTSAKAPRELVLATKASIRTTSTLTRQSEAVDVELGPQLESLRSDGFRAGLERVRARR
jgi:enoyl-CoA hydratase